MRIVFLLNSLGMGGAERQTLALAERMAQRGHTVEILTLMPRLAEEWPTTLPVTALGLRKTPWHMLATLLRARRFLDRFRPVLVHSHNFHANLFARLLRASGGTFALVCTVHNVYEGGALRMFAYRVTDRFASRVTAVSQAAADRFVALRAVSRKKMQTVLNGIDTAEFAPDAARRQATRHKFQSDEAFVWIAAGRVVPAKDYPNLLRAFALLLEQKPAALLQIAGAADSDYLDSLRELATSLGVAPRVQWLGLRRDLPALFDAADAFVLASAWEGLPLVLGEAMSMAKPVVATDVGGVWELVDDVGRLVPSRDPHALAQSMLECMALSADERAAQGQAARQRILDAFSIEARAERWSALYAEFDAQNE